MSVELQQGMQDYENKALAPNIINISPKPIMHNQLIAVRTGLGKASNILSIIKSIMRRIIAQQDILQGVA